MDKSAIKDVLSSLGKLLVPDNFKVAKEVNAKSLLEIAQSKYKTETPEERYQNFLKGILKDLKSDANFGHVYKVAVIPEDLDEFVTEFIKDLTDKGFLIINLQIIEPKILRPHIFIYWGLMNGGIEK